ncbi:hypothetical protein IAT38_005935 [Cryptococcus sp. DSM 104549]
MDAPAEAGPSRPSTPVDTPAPARPATPPVVEPEPAAVEETPVVQEPPTLAAVEDVVMEEAASAPAPAAPVEGVEHEGDKEAEKEVVVDEPEKEEAQAPAPAEPALPPAAASPIPSPAPAPEPEPAPASPVEPITAPEPTAPIPQPEAAVKPAPASEPAPPPADEAVELLLNLGHLTEAAVQMPAAPAGESAGDVEMKESGEGEEASEAKAEHGEVDAVAKEEPDHAPTAQSPTAPLPAAPSPPTRTTPDTEPSAPTTSKPKQKRKRGSTAGPSRSAPAPTPAPTTPASRPAHYLGEDNTIIRCICGVSEDDGFTIQCEGCGTWEHGICFGYNDERDAPDTFFCEQCDVRPVNREVAARLQASIQQGLRQQRAVQAMQNDAAGGQGAVGAQGQPGGAAGQGDREREKPRSRQGKAKRQRLDSVAEGEGEQAREMGPPAAKPPKRGKQAGIVGAGGGRSRGKGAGAGNGGGNGGSGTNGTGTVESTPAPGVIPDDPGDAYFRFDPWKMEYTPIRENIVRGVAARQAMRAVYKEWVDAEEEMIAASVSGKAVHNPSGLPSPTETGMLRLSPEHLFPPADYSILGPPVPPVFLSGPDLGALGSAYSIAPIDATPSFLPLTYADHLTMPAVYTRPTIYGVFADTPLAPGAFVGEYRAEVTDCETYRRDPINQYSALGLPKPHVRSVGPPVNLMLDARAYGADLRFVRSGCHPNVVLRPLLWRATEDEPPKLKFGVFAAKEIAKKDELVLAWEWDDQHLVHSLRTVVHPAMFSDGSLAHPSFTLNAHTRALAGRFDAVLTHIFGTFSSCACTVPGPCALAQMANFFQIVDGRSSLAPQSDKEVAAVTPGAGENGQGGSRKKMRVDLGELVGSVRGWRRRELDSEMAKRWRVEMAGMKFEREESAAGGAESSRAASESESEEEGSRTSRASRSRSASRSESVAVSRGRADTSDSETESDRPDADESMDVDVDEPEPSPEPAVQRDLSSSSPITTPPQLSPAPRSPTPPSPKSHTVDRVISSSSLSSAASAPAREPEVEPSSPLSRRPSSAQSSSSPVRRGAKTARRGRRAVSDEDEEMVSASGSGSDSESGSGSSSDSASDSGSGSDSDAPSHARAHSPRSHSGSALTSASSDRDSGAESDATTATMPRSVLSDAESSSDDERVVAPRPRGRKRDVKMRSVSGSGDDSDRPGRTGRGASADDSDGSEEDSEEDDEEDEEYARVIRSKHRAHRPKSRILSSPAPAASTSASNSAPSSRGKKSSTPASTSTGKTAQKKRAPVSSASTGGVKRRGKRVVESERSGSDSEISADDRETKVESAKSEDEEKEKEEKRAVVPEQVVAPMAEAMEVEESTLEPEPAVERVPTPPPREPTPPPKEPTPEPPKKVSFSEYLKTHRFRKTSEIVPTGSSESVASGSGVEAASGEAAKDVATGQEAAASGTPGLGLNAAPTTPAKLEPGAPSSTGINLFDFLPSSRAASTPLQQGPAAISTASTPLAATPLESPSTGTRPLVTPSASYVPRQVSGEYFPYQAPAGQPVTAANLGVAGGAAPTATAAGSTGSYAPRVSNSYTPRQVSVSSEEGSVAGSAYVPRSPPTQPRAEMPPPLAARDPPPHSPSASTTGISASGLGQPRQVSATLATPMSGTPSAGNALPRAPPTGPKVPPTGPRFGYGPAAAAAAAGGVGPVGAMGAGAGAATGAGAGGGLGRGGFGGRGGFVPRGIWRGRGGFRGRGRGA